MFYCFKKCVSVKNNICKKQFFMAEWTKSFKKRVKFPSKHWPWHCVQCITLAECWQSVNELQTGGSKAPVTTSGHRLLQHLDQNGCMLQDVLQWSKEPADLKSKDFIPFTLWLSIKWGSQRFSVQHWSDHEFSKNMRSGHYCYLCK